MTEFVKCYFFVINSFFKAKNVEHMFGSRLSPRYSDASPPDLAPRE